MSRWVYSYFFLFAPRDARKSARKSGNLACKQVLGQTVINRDAGTWESPRMAVPERCIARTIRYLPRTAKGLSSAVEMRRTSLRHQRSGYLPTLKSRLPYLLRQESKPFADIVFFLFLVFSFSNVRRGKSDCLSNGSQSQCYF